ncbi:hypothetical protein EB796_005164 [Bugula neritina]|uniref:Uncharacterized protein n=1 Tax=Bugula neritina TaxID=10212 RepID=A0A7J7KE80_BUGNE|nr:hypothetical protein EB796_005164 [Bugula neritina]
MQVEEEEEANRDSDRDTYTIEDDYTSDNATLRLYRLDRAVIDTLTLTSGDGRRLPAKNQRAAVLAAEYGSGTDMISKMKDQLNATTEMCQHLLQEQHKLQCRITEQPNSADPWMESRIVYSVNQLFSQVTDMQAALKVTIDQVYGITQRIDSAEALSGLPIWARPSTALNLQSETRPGARPVSQLQSRLTQTGSVYSQQTDQSQSEGGDKTPTLELFQNSGRSERSGKTDSQTETARLNLGDHSYSILLWILTS